MRKSVLVEIGIVKIGRRTEFVLSYGMFLALATSRNAEKGLRPFKRDETASRGIGPALGICSVVSGVQMMLNNKNRDPGSSARWSADNNKPSCGASTPDDGSTEIGQHQSRMESGRVERRGAALSTSIERML
jgi:hypothetical protein